MYIKIDAVLESNYSYRHPGTVHPIWVQLLCIKQNMNCFCGGGQLKVWLILWKVVI